MAAAVREKGGGLQVDPAPLMIGGEGFRGESELVNALADARAGRPLLYGAVRPGTATMSWWRLRSWHEGEGTCAPRFGV